MVLSVIIVNFNTIQLTLQCVNSILKHTSPTLNFEIIVIDNASSDGSQAILSKLENIIYIQSNENLGFGKANNLGAKHAKGDYLFLLNSDTILLEDSISNMYNFISTNEKQLKIGGLGCVLVDQNLIQNGTAFKFTTVFNVITKTLRLNFLLSSDFKKKYFHNDQYTKVDYIIGADLMIKKALFDSVNGFDPDFFMYFEEQDLQKRIHKLGFDFYILNNTKIVHLEGGSNASEKKLSAKRRIMIQQGRNLFLKKNSGMGYYAYVTFDFFYTFIRFFNTNYSFSENVEFMKLNFKSY